MTAAPLLVLIDTSGAGSGAIPLCCGLLFPFAKPFNTFFGPVGAGRQDAALFKTCRDLLRSIAFQGHAVNPVRYLDRLLVHAPQLGIVRGLPVAVGW